MLIKFGKEYINTMFIERVFKIQYTEHEFGIALIMRCGARIESMRIETLDEFARYINAVNRI